MDSNTMSSVEGMAGDYVGYEYKEIVTESSKASFLLDGYRNFGWEVDRNITESVMNQLPGGPAAYQKKVVLRLKRNRKIINRMELTRLQRNFEACVNEIARLESLKTSKATMCALIMGILGTAFMAGSVFAVTAPEPLIVLCILLAIPGFGGWIMSYFVYKTMVAKESENATKLIEMKYDEIDEICEKGHKLILFLR